MEINFISVIIENKWQVAGRFDWLDALRGIAAFAVMMYHARSILWIGLGETWEKHGMHPDFDAAVAYALTPFSFGYLGVTLFFVISGFSIHYKNTCCLVSHGLNAKLPLREFFLRRFLRLYPTYVGALVVTACIDAFLLKQLSELAAADDHSVSSFLATLCGLQGWVSPHFGSASVFWTLVLEMHLYLAYPLLFHLSRTHGPEFVLSATLAVQVATLFLLAYFHAPDRWPYWYAGGPLFLKFWFTWTVGMYAAESFVGRAKAGWLSWRFGLLGLITGVVATVWGCEDVADISLAVSFGWLLVHMAHRPCRAGWMLKPAALLGVVCYCLYSIHIPLLRLTRVFINSGRPSESILPVFIGAFVALVGAIALYFLIDRRSITLSQDIGKNPKA